MFGITHAVGVGVGILSCLDGYMNIAMEQTEEHAKGVVTNKYGDAFIRGNNGMFPFRIPALFHRHGLRKN